MVKVHVRVLSVLCLILPLAACQGPAITAEQDAELRGVFDQVRRGDLQAVESAFDPQYRAPTLHAGLPGMRSMIPPGQPRIQRLNSASEKDKQGRLNYGASYEYDYPGSALLAQIQMRQDTAGRKTITALRVVRAEPHLVDRYRFGLIGRTPQNYLFLVLVVLAPLLGFWGIASVWRAPDLPRRWKPLWTLAMALGFMDLTMDWTTGDVVIQVVSVHILYLTAHKFGPLSPWMISTSLPLASIAFLIGYRPPKR